MNVLIEWCFNKLLIVIKILFVFAIFSQLCNSLPILQENGAFMQQGTATRDAVINAPGESSVFKTSSKGQWRSIGFFLLELTTFTLNKSPNAKCKVNVFER